VWIMMAQPTEQYGHTLGVTVAPLVCISPILNAMQSTLSRRGLPTPFPIPKGPHQGQFIQLFNVVSFFISKC
jgi:hypothetical protein